MKKEQLKELLEQKLWITNWSKEEIKLALEKWG